MENGKHVAVEVPAALDLEGCWELVDASERTGLHCMMLENCCYDFFELQTLNMVRQGVFGELTHAEGAYIHSLVDYMQTRDGEEIYQGNWRLHRNLERNGNLYPTHGLGPVAQCLDINRGNRFLYLTSMSSQQAAFTEHARLTDNPDFADLPSYRGDMNTTMLKCAGGQTVMIQHDTSTPRAYSRIHLIQGSRGGAQVAAPRHLPARARPRVGRRRRPEGAGGDVPPPVDAHHRRHRQEGGRPRRDGLHHGLSVDLLPEERPAAGSRRVRRRRVERRGAVELRVGGDRVGFRGRARLHARVLANQRAAGNRGRGSRPVAGPRRRGTAEQLSTP